MPTVTFQQDAGYTGTVDVTIREAKPKSSPGGALTLFVEGDSNAEVQALLAFAGLFGSGPGQIPIGVTITSATLTLRVSDATTSSIGMSRMLIDWSEQSSWRALGDGVQLNGIEAASTADFIIAGAPKGNLTLDVTASLQAWLSGATSADQANAANNGWVFTGLGTDKWAFRSSESAFAPLLTVTYSTAGGGGGGSSQLGLAGPVSQVEGTAASATPFVFTVNRTGDTSGTVSVEYDVTGSGGAPAAANDFAGGVFPDGTIVFAPGELSKTITINVNADSTSESNETFLLTLSGATGGAQIGTGTATGTILDDDGSSGGTGAILGVRIDEGSSFGTGTGNNRFGSTDPTDVVYDPSTGTLFLCDSEVDESPFFAGNNLFKLTGSGTLLSGYSLKGFTSEPTGLAFWQDPNSGSKFLFICSDDQKRIFVVDPDDPTVVLRSFSTTLFGVHDPEDLSINPNNGNLFVLSENDKSIYEVTQDGVFVSKVTLPDPFKSVVEGLVYDAENDQFYVCGGFSSKIFIVSRSGQLTDTIDILSQYPNDGGYRVFPKGLELAPSSDGSGRLSLWVTDYGKDQVADGRLFEIMFDRPALQSGSLSVSTAALDPLATETSTSQLPGMETTNPNDVPIHSALFRHGDTHPSGVGLGQEPDSGLFF